MPRCRTRSRILGILFFLSFATTTSWSGNVASLRITSLDAALGDLQRIGASFSAEGLTRDAMLGMLSGALGLPDTSFHDPARPIVLAVPLEGLMLGAGGVVAAVPTKDSVAALGVIERKWGQGTADDQGVRSFETAQGTTFVAARGGHIVVGRTRSLVAMANVAELTAPFDGPPGSVSLDLDLKALSPMIMMGVGMARGMAQQQVAAGGNTDGAPNPAAALAMAGVYLDLVQDVLTNSDRLQMSFEVGTQDLIFHTRLVPRGGSTLAGLVAAQKGGLPELARYITPGEHDVMLMAGQIRYTPAFLDALNGYVRRYAEAIGTLAETSPEFAGPATDLLGVWQAILAGDTGSWTSCYRGDFAASFGIEPDGGWRMAQVLGAADPVGCEAFLGRMSAALAATSVPGAGVKIATSEGALVYSGVRARRQQISIDPAQWSQQTQPAAQDADSFRRFFGEDLTTHFGAAGDLVLATTGASSEADFRRLVDRVQGRTEGAGIRPSEFEPLAVGPGFFMVYDMGKLFGSMAEAFEGSADMAALAGMKDARMTYGVRFATGGVALDVALPTSFLDAIGARAGRPPTPAP